MYYLTVSLEQKSGHSLIGSSVPCLPRLISRCWLGCILSGGSLRSYLFSDTFRLLAEFVSFWLYSWEVWCFLVCPLKNHLQFLEAMCIAPCHWFFLHMAAYFIKPTWRTSCPWPSLCFKRAFHLIKRAHSG